MDFGIYYSRELLRLAVVLGLTRGEVVVEPFDVAKEKESAREKKTG